jgi:DNA-binding transcriptional LysR family regulator
VDTFTSIKVFRQVVDSGSFVRAAELLDMSTPMVSRHVLHAEQRLGVRLLNRNNRSLSLTEPGRLYFERCRSILEELQATELELGCLGSVPRGTLRVSVPNSASGQWLAASGQWLAELIAEYRRRYPEVLLDLSFEDRFVNLVDEGYDLALRIAVSPDAVPAGVVARPLLKAVFQLAASHDYLKRRGVPKFPEDLAQHEFIAVGDMLNCLPRPAGTGKGVVLRYRSIDGVADAVAAGIGIAPVPAVLFEDPAFREVLTPVLPDYPLRQATLYVVYASRRFLPPKLRTFVDFIVEFLSSASEPKPRLFRAPRPAYRAPLTSIGEARMRRKADTQLTASAACS